MNTKIIIIPIIFSLILAIILTNFLVSFENKIFNEQSNKIKNNIILEEKNNIKSNIDNIINILNQKTKSVINLQKDIIKERTNNAIHIIDNIYKKNKNLSNEKIFEKIKEELNFIYTTDKSKYFFIYKMDGTCISVPVNKKIEKKIEYIVEYKPLHIFIGTAIYEQDIIKNIKQFSSKLLSNFKTSQGGYIFAYDEQGNTIAHIKKELIGTNRWNLQKNGKFLVQEIIKEGKQKGGKFLKYAATTNPNTKQSTHKISYVNEFKKLQWIIGTGFYTDEVYSRIKISQDKLKSQFDKELKNIIISMGISTILLIIFLWIVLNKLSQKMIHYKNKLENNNKKLSDLNINLESKVEERTKELNDSYSEIKYILNSTMVGIFISKNGFCIDVNDEAVRLFGYPNKNSMLGKKSTEFTADDFVSTVSKNMKDNYTKPYEIDMKRYDGTTFPGLVKGSSFKRGDTLLRIATTIDLTELKDKERLLFEQSKLASMGEMIGNIAHQWRQPLNAISSASIVINLKAQSNKLDNDIALRLSNSISKNTEYLSSTIDDFRNFIKAERTKRIFNLKNNIDSFLHLVDGSIVNNNINIIFDLQEDIEINGYENELTQCIINIFNNAKEELIKKDKKLS